MTDGPDARISDATPRSAYHSADAFPRRRGGGSKIQKLSLPKVGRNQELLLHGSDDDLRKSDDNLSIFFILLLVAA